MRKIGSVQNGGAAAAAARGRGDPTAAPARASAASTITLKPRIGKAERVPPRIKTHFHS